MPPPAEPIYPDPVEEAAPNDQTTLLQNEEESFALAPVDASALKGKYYLYLPINKEHYFLVIIYKMCRGKWAVI